MTRAIHLIVLFCAVSTFVTLAISTGTTNWKEDLDVYKGMHKYIGLWKACVIVKEDSVSELPAYSECDRDFLRPRLVNPPGMRRENDIPKRKEIFAGRKFCRI